MRLIFLFSAAALLFSTQLAIAQPGQGYGGPMMGPGGDYRHGMMDRHPGSMQGQSNGPPMGQQWSQQWRGPSTYRGAAGQPPNWQQRHEQMMQRRDQMMQDRRDYMRGLRGPAMGQQRHGPMRGGHGYMRGPGYSYSQ